MFVSHWFTVIICFLKKDELSCVKEKKSLNKKTVKTVFFLLLLFVLNYYQSI